MGNRTSALAIWLVSHELLVLGAIAPLLLYPGLWSLPALVLLGLIWLSRRLTSGAFSARTALDPPLVALLACGLTGLYASVSPATSTSALARLLLGVALFYALVNRLRAGPARRWLLPALLAACIGLTLLTLGGTRWSIVRLASWPALYAHLPVLFRGPDGDGAFHPRMMGMALATLLPIPLALACFGASGRFRLSAALLALFMAGAILLTQSIQALGGLAPALLLLAAWRDRRALLAVPLAAVGLSAAGVALWRADLVTRLLNIDDLLGHGVVLRIDIWSRAMAMLGDMPFTGIGLNSFPLVQTHFYPGYGIGPELHAHNLFLQIALDTGLFGLLALLWLLIGAGWIAWHGYSRQAAPGDRLLLVALAAALLAYVGSQLIETYWQTAPNLLLWALLGALVGVAGPPPQPAGARLPKSRAALWWPWLIIPALVGASFLLIPHLWAHNLAVVTAQKQIFRLRAGEAVPAQALARSLEDVRAAQSDSPADPQFAALLGSLEAWRGEEGAAVAAFRRRVALDLQAPLERYAPFAALRRQLIAEPATDPAQDLLRVYRQWLQRFPGRAEEYLQVALVLQECHGETARALALLQQGLDHKAEPEGLLLGYRAALASATPTHGVRLGNCPLMARAASAAGTTCWALRGQTAGRSPRSRSRPPSASRAGFQPHRSR